MLSALSQGCGAWDGSGHVVEGNDRLPVLDLPANHKHGVTVRSPAKRRKARIITVEEVDGSLHIPKTYLTRKGALVLYSSEKDASPREDSDRSAKGRKKSSKQDPESVARVLENLGNVRRLMASVLYLNDREEPDPDSSVSDDDNQVYLGFLRNLDSVLHKQKLQPGRDLTFYINALRVHARKLSDVTGADISNQIHAMLATPSSRPSTTTATASSRVLSSAKLTASLKSNSYMGRKITYPELDPSFHELGGAGTPLSISAWSTFPGTHPNTTNASSDSDSTIEEEEPLRASSAHQSRAKSARLQPGAARRESHSAGQLLDESKRPVSAQPGRTDGSLVSRPYSGISIKTGSSSLVDDPSLLEEMEISLPTGPEPDSDLENEYFESVLNVDELPRPDVPHGDVGHDRVDIASSSASNRHLTNTPDLDKTFTRAGDSQPFTPEVTLRRGTSATFNIFATHVDNNQPLDNTTRFKSKRTKSAYIEQVITPTKQTQRPVTSLSQQSNDQNINLGFGSPTADVFEIHHNASHTSRAGSAKGHHSAGSAKSQQGTEHLNDAMNSLSLGQTQHGDEIGLDTADGEHTNLNKPQIFAEANDRSELDLSSGAKLPELFTNEGRETPAPLSRPVSAESQSTRGSRPVSGKPSSAGSRPVSGKHSSGDQSNTLSLPQPENISMPLENVEEVELDPPTPSPVRESLAEIPPVFSSPLPSEDTKIKPKSDSPVLSNISKDKQHESTTLTMSKFESVELKPLPPSPRPPSVAKPRSRPASSKTPKPVQPKPAATKQINGLGPKQTKKPSSATRRTVTPATAQSTAPPGDIAVDVTGLGKGEEKPKADSRKRTPAPPVEPVIKVRGDDREALERAELMRQAEQRTLQALMKDPEEVTKMMSSHMADEFDEEGLTVEEMELAQEMLREKLAEAEKGIEKNLSAIDSELKKTEAQLTAVDSKSKDKKGKKKTQSDESQAKKRELAEKKEAIRAAKRAEQQRRVAEKKALQEKIVAKSREKDALMSAEAEKLRDIQEREAYQAAVAEEARIQEEEARKALVLTRREAKEERERRRKEDLERRKEEAIRRRADQRRLQDAARQKELDMLEAISDAETTRELRERERKRKEEEEWALQAKLAEEERLAGIRAEDEEARIANIERESEENAMARLIEERMEAERLERELEISRRELQDNEEQRRMALELEQNKIEQELRLKEEEEEKQREAERQRILELKKLEAEAQEKMRREIEERRSQLLRLREENLEKKKHLETVKRNQAYTKPWAFSYYVSWPRDTYERMMGGDGGKKRKIPKKKK